MPGEPPKKIITQPLLTEVQTLLLGTLCTGAEVFEFGSGGSTVWLASRAARLVSIEHDTDWHAVIADALLEHGWPSVDLRLVKLPEMARAIDNTGEWDVVFVDCLARHRERAITLSATHVKPGGWLVADDWKQPGVKRAVERLRRAGWDVTMVTGHKMHPLRSEIVKAATAFCRRPMSCS